MNQQQYRRMLQNKLKGRKKPVKGPVPPSITVVMQTATAANDAAAAAKIAADDAQKDIDAALSESNPNSVYMIASEADKLSKSLDIDLKQIKDEKDNTSMIYKMNDLSLKFANLTSGLDDTDTGLSLDNILDRLTLAQNDLKTLKDNKLDNRLDNIESRISVTDTNIRLNGNIIKNNNVFSNLRLAFAFPDSDNRKIDTWDDIPFFGTAVFFTFPYDVKLDYTTFSFTTKEYSDFKGRVMEIQCLETDSFILATNARTYKPTPVALYSTGAALSKYDQTMVINWNATTNNQVGVNKTVSGVKNNGTLVSGKEYKFQVRYRSSQNYTGNIQIKGFNASFLFSQI